MGRCELYWNPFDQADPGPVINVIIMNSRDVLERGRAIGFEYPEPRPLKALLDTGASVTLISRAFAEYSKLFQTSADTEVAAIGTLHRCGEHAGSISFPGTDLRAYDPVRIISAVFAKERHYACLIGRDILRNWVLTFDGRSRRVTIVD